MNNLFVQLHNLFERNCKTIAIASALLFRYLVQCFAGQAWEKLLVFFFCETGGIASLLARSLSNILEPILITVFRYYSNILEYPIVVIWTRLLSAFFCYKTRSLFNRLHSMPRRKRERRADPAERILPELLSRGLGKERREGRQRVAFAARCSQFFREVNFFPL
jgi:hypothetical protein